MNIFKITLILALFACTGAIAAPATDTSIQELLEITQAKKMIDGITTQVEGQMGAAAQKSLNGKTPTPAQQQAIDKMKGKMITLMRSELAWEKQEPANIRLYKETFTEEEVRGLIAFYSTPAGQAMINKMPVLMQKVMNNVQTSIGTMMPAMQAIQKEFEEEMKAANK